MKSPARVTELASVSEYYAEILIDVSTGMYKLLTTQANTHL